MTVIRESWLTSQESKAVMAMLTGAGHQAYFVGGCVRNALMNRPVADLDITTDALPKVVAKLAKDSGLRVVPTGIDHGTVTVISGGTPYEITTFRKDIETDGRRAVVAFSDSITDDALRRDFTMNALYANSQGQVSDPLSGMADLTARRVRFIEDADQRIKEDYLRSLRFFRFHAWYGDPKGGLDADGLAAVAANLNGLRGLSRERVGSEVLKLLAAPDPAPAVAAMQQSGVLAEIMPGASAQDLAALVHLEDGMEPNPLRRLAALGGSDLSERLRLSRAQSEALAVFKTGIESTAGAAELGYRYGAGPAEDIVLLRAAMSGQAMPDRYQDAVAFGSTRKFPVTAKDLMPELSGPALGARLRELETRWIHSDFELTRSQLLS